MTFHGAVGKGLGEVGFMDVIMIEQPDEDGQVIVAICREYQLLWFPSRMGLHTDQRSVRQDVLHSVVDAEHASMAAVRPEEPGPRHESAEDQRPASARRSRMGDSVSRGRAFDCCFPVHRGGCQGR